jgi:hypothetical protein
LRAAVPVFAALTAAIYVLLFAPMGSHDWTRAGIGTGAAWGSLIASAV